MQSLDPVSNSIAVSADQRHQERIALMQLVFAHTFLDEDQQFVEMDSNDAKYASFLSAMKADLPAIDQEIAQYAPERPLAEINKVDLAIMRLIIFESRHHNTPKKVLIDEAVEIAKEFGTESSPKFVNGVLGKVLFIEELAPQETDGATENEKKDSHEPS